MQRYLRRAIELLSALALTKERKPSVIEQNHTKCRTSAPETKYFKRVSPSSLGVSPKLLSSMLSALEAEPRANVHNLMLIKDGRVILECSAPGYDTNTFHLSHSMSKTITGIAIGFLVEEYKLDISSRLTDIFPEVPFSDKRFADITVEHLLSMRSGVPFSELGTATETEWTETFFTSELSFAPGEKFHYNSLNSYILAKIVLKLSGMGLVEYLTPRLFTPLHITNLLWETSPEGVEKGGFGLYMSTESWAKVGMTLLNMGIFEGKQIIPRSWILRSITERSIAPESLGAFNYGYHVWVNRTNDEFLLNGMLGQNVWVCPKNNMVLALNSGNSELFQGSAALDIIRAHLGGELTHSRGGVKEMHELKLRVKNFFKRRHPVRPKQPLRGISYTLGLRNAIPFDNGWMPIVGEYALPDNNFGLLPLFVSVMQNNFTGGIERLKLERIGNSLMLTAVEGGVTRRLEVGIYNFKTTTLTYGGETYIVNALGEALEDEDRNAVYKIELVFPELPNSRLIKLREKDGRLLIQLSETPNQKFAETYLSGMTSGGKIGFAMGIIERKLGENFLGRKLEEAFNPELLAISTASAGWEETLLKENTLAREAISRGEGQLAALISKFITDDKRDKEQKPKEKRGGFFGLFGRKKAARDITVITPAEALDSTEGDEASAEASDTVSSNNRLLFGQETDDIAEGIPTDIEGLLPPQDGDES